VAIDPGGGADGTATHSTCDYSLDEPDGWCGEVAEFRQFRQDDGSTVVLRDGCPRCRGTMSVDLPILARCGQTVGVDKDAEPLPPGKEFVKVAWCNCGHAHSGRPENSLGCGAFGSLWVGKAPADPNAEPTPGQYVRVDPLPGEATVTDVEWERRAEQQEIAALPAARTAAEKWTTQIASLTGIFSIVVLVKGPEDVTNLEGQVGRLVPTDSLIIAALVSLLALALVAFAYRRWPEQAWTHSVIKWTAQVLALASVVAAMLVWDQRSGWPVAVIALLLAVVLPAAAELEIPRHLFADDTDDWRAKQGRWSAQRLKWTPGAARWTARLVGLASLLAAGLIWARHWSWEIAVIVSLALALTCAAIAVLAGGLAAYDIPARFAPASGGLLRTGQRAQIRRARNGLRASLAAAVGAIVFVAVAVAATWTHTPADATPGAALLVTRHTQAPICGRYAGEKDGELLLQQKGLTAPTGIPFAEITSTASVPACAGE
jgi:hypothetical protein